jgi:transposase
LEPLLREVESLSERIQEYDRRIARMAKDTYPETTLLKQVKGVGDLIATAYVLTIEDPHRFRKSRDAGCFVGLQPGRRNCWGQKLAERGGKNAKKRAVVAVARKLAVLLHRLWVSGEVYEPLRNSQKEVGVAA